MEFLSYSSWKFRRGWEDLGFTLRVGRGWDVSRPVAAGYDENLEPKDTRSGGLVAADLEK